MLFNPIRQQGKDVYSWLMIFFEKKSNITPTQG